MFLKQDSLFARLSTLHTLRAVAGVLSLTVLAGTTCGAELSESELVRQLAAKPSANVSAPSEDPDAVFANPDSQSKNLARVRAPDTNGACLGGEGGGLQSKALVVIALAPTGAPQVNLPLQFANASYVLSESDSRQLDALARAMNSLELRGARFTLSGHTDATGDALTNQKLSCARALSARTYLLDRGIAATRLGAYGFGSSRPVVQGAGAVAENRRVEIRRAED